MDKEKEWIEVETEQVVTLDSEDDTHDDEMEIDFED